MSKWFYGDNNILWGILIINSCMHGFQKLNCYNHVFKNYLQVLELDIKICGSLKNKFQVFENRWNTFASFWIFFKHFNIDVVNILI